MKHITAPREEIDKIIAEINEKKLSKDQARELLIKSFCDAPLIMVTDSKGQTHFI